MTSLEYRSKLQLGNNANSQSISKNPLMKGDEMGKYISPELYNKYKHQVLDMSLAVQYYIGLEQQRESSCLSDREIAQRLRLSVEEVREIRTIAQNDLLPAEAWIEADQEKRRKRERFFHKRPNSARLPHNAAAEG